MALLTEATFTNVNTASVNLLGAGTTFRDITWSYEMAGSEFGKQQDSGEQESHSFVRKLVITIDGQITGTSDANYWTNRGSVLGGFLVSRGTQTAYTHGRLTITPSGGAQVYADCVIDSNSFPLTHDEAPSKSSKYQVTLRCFYGYWRTVSGGTVVKI